MGDTDKYPPLHLPARDIPVPSTISEEAKAVLGNTAMVPVQDWPEDLTDKAAVAKVIDDWVGDMPIEFSAPLFGMALRADGGAQTEHMMLGDVSVYVATPDGFDESDPRTHMAIHGAFIFGGGKFSQAGAAYTAAALGLRVWAVDYRMPPYHPHPVPLDDCLVVYRELLERYGARNISIGGTSGGGNLTLATLLRAQDEGLPMAAAAVVNTPYADLTHAGDTIQMFYGTVDRSTTPGNLDVIRKIYCDEQDMRHPYISPVFGDYGSDFPPTLLTSGTRDFLLSDTVRVHRKLLAAGVEAELHVWEAAAHYMFAGTAPEDREHSEQTRLFLQKHLPASRSPTFAQSHES
ncbi:alpha/beta hydrolase fold domain-containing protein [Sphingobium sp. SA916]|uniref:alpha/beta hydrolase fold domain-containing protein n=1 Tax=Sphingobium sp. SA916 TaxID=1851207 RepID=UPI000C9FA20D|nr:alpha/beta hydrolase fold domain-containing protein [Sphingobium sp. SA916]PNP97990.1 hypothetical protein A8G00_21245 [Sphingobium sp. SA916]